MVMLVEVLMVMGMWLQHLIVEEDRMLQETLEHLVLEAIRQLLLILMLEQLVVQDGMEEDVIVLHQLQQVV